MNNGYAKPSTISLLASVGFVAVGVGINSGLDASVRIIPALVAISIGLVGIVSNVSHRPLAQIRHIAKRWWVLAFAAFVPYGIVAAPSGEGAVALSEALSGWISLPVLETIAGVTLLCAISVTTLYLIGLYGIHPGRLAPEERLLSECDDD